MLTRLDRVRAELDRASDALGTVLPEEIAREEPAASPARIGELEQVVAEREARIGELEQVVGEREAQVNVLRSLLSVEQDQKRDALGLKAQVLHRLDAIQTSASWQLAGSLRALESRWPKIVRGIAAIPKLAWWALTLRLPQRLRVRRQASELLETGLFDRAWYVENNSDIILNGQNPVLHWLAIGWTEGRDPNPLFDTDRYLEQNPDVTATGINPLYHYLLRGQREVRRTGRFVAPRATFPKAMAERWTAELRADPAFARLQEAMPLVSILMPTRNRAHILPRAIDSVLAQRWQHWELFVVDDHSTDGTADLITRRYADSRIRLLTNDGRGVSDARNRGLAESRGDFVAYLDSDNHWTPEYLELMLAELERSGLDSAYAVLMRITGPQGQPGTKVNYRYGRFDFEQLKFENYIDINVFMHQRRLYEDLGGFDPTLKRMVDWDLILRYTRERAPAQAMFIGVHYDASPAEDRITTTERASYLNVVRNKHWIDWERQLADAGAREPELVSIIICVCGRIDLTDACLHSLFRHEAGERFELILVDNASDPETARRLREWEASCTEIRLIRNPENLNFALGNNVGFAASRGARVVFLNNDTEVTPEWLRALVRPLADPTVLGVQPRLLYPDGTIQAIGIVFSDRSPMGYPIYVGQPATLAAAQRPRDFAAVTAACVAFRAEDFARMRGFDPIYVNGQEDIDLCLRLGGGRPVFRYAADSVLFHHESQSPGRRKNIESNRRIFHERWQGKVRADDHRYYAQDGIEAIDHAPDNPAWAAAGYAVWRPKLVALPGDGDLYPLKYPEVAEAGANPLVHYLTENTPGPIPGPINLPPCRDLSIVVPVLNAAKELERCLKSLLKYSDRDIRKIVINDASTDPDVLVVIKRFREVPGFSFHENERNQGFTKTVNWGIRLAGRSDVIVLNADTEVTPGWIRGLRVAAYSSESVATATPLSNSASHFSVPRMGDNPTPYWMSIDSYARSIAHCSDLLHPRTPTAHGFCMFVKRKFIDEVGVLDADAFPVGYGEEVDLSMRGARRGWHHVVADNVFVFHVNAASFGVSKQQRLKGARRAIDQRYPEYSFLIREFRNSDTMKKIRAGSLRAWSPMTQALPRILFVIPAGVAEGPQPGEELMRLLAGSFNLLFLTSDSRTISLFKISECKRMLLESSVLEYPVSPITHRSEDYDRILSSWLVRYAIEVVHIHHIARHSQNLPAISKQIGIPVVCSSPDRHAVCPTVDLPDENGPRGGICTEIEAQSPLQGERGMADAYSAIYDSLIHRDASSMSDGCASKAKRSGSPATKKLCVGLIVSTDNGGLQVSAHTRLLAPLSHPRLQGTVSIRLLDERSITRLSECDVVVVQHAAIKDAESATSLCNELVRRRVPMVLDIDIALDMMVSSEHQENSAYEPSARSLAVLLDGATEVWTSTQALATTLKLPMGRYRVIESCLDRRIWAATAAEPIRKSAGGLCRFLYVDVQPDDSDLGLVVEALDRLYERKVDDFELTLIGAKPKNLERPWLQSISLGGEEVPYPVLVSWMLRQGPFDVGLAPLVDTPGNRLVSDAKLLEYAAMKVTPLASDIVPYRGEMLRRGLFQVVQGRIHDWVEVLGKIVVDPTEYRKKALPIHDYLWAERDSGSAAEKMEEAMLQLSPSSRAD